jgi:hypothetical protein
MWGGGEKKRQEKRSERRLGKKDFKTPLSLDQSTVSTQADHHDDSGRRI